MCVRRTHPLTKGAIKKKERKKVLLPAHTYFPLKKRGDEERALLLPLLLIEKVDRHVELKASCTSSLRPHTLAA
jgi:hypothetical protein